MHKATSLDFRVTISQDGQQCGIPVNVSKCQYCSHHVEKEYNRMSSMRKELQGGALRTAFKSSARLNFKPGVFEADINSKKPMLPKASSQTLMAAAEKASSRGISRGASYVRTCADPIKALNEVKEEQHARLQTAARQHGKDQAPIPRRHIPNVVCINPGNKKSCETGEKQDKRKPYLTSLAGRSLLPQTDSQASKMVELDETESMCDFAHQVCSKLPESSDINRKKAIEILKRKRDDKKEVEAPGFLVHSLEHHQGKQEDSNIEDAKSIFERKYLAETDIEDEREIDGPAISRKSAKSACRITAGRKQSMAVKKVGTSRTELGNAFGSIIDEMADKEDKKIHSKFKSIVEAEQDENMKNLLDVLEKRDNMADKMDSIKAMEVQAWECTVCHVILERKHPRCIQMHPNALKRRSATKRWWKCLDCKQHFSTVGVTYPVGGCPKCDSVQANFEKSSMLKPMSKTMDEMLSGGLACKENLLPRGREQKWVNS